MPSQDINDYINKFNVSNIQSPDALADSTDNTAPLPFKDWLAQHTSISSGNEFKEYNSYLKAWYSQKRISKINQLNNLKSDYVNFIKELTILFQDDPEFKYISDVNYDDDLDIEYAIPYFTKKIKEICFYIISKRESAKNAKLKYNTAGSTQAIEKLFYQYILKAFTQKNTLIEVPEFSGVNTLPQLSGITNTFGIEIEELNDQGNYFDKDPSVSYEVDTSATSYFDNLEYSGSYQWIFDSGHMPLCSDNPLFFVLSATLNSYGADSVLSLPYSATDLSDRLSPTLNETNLSLLTEKYVGNDFFILTGGHFILKEKEFIFDLSQGNNWMYWPNGEAEFELDPSDEYDAIDINETSLLTDGATYDRDYRKADKMFVERDGIIHGAWLRDYKAVTTSETMSCTLIPDQQVHFKFPFPNYGIVGENTVWTGRTISNLDSVYNLLDEDSQKIVDQVYWNYYTTTDQICAIKINETSLVTDGAFPSVYYNDSDKISKRTATNANKVNDSSKDSVYKDGFEYAWLYEFLKTDLPIKNGRNEILFPIERIQDDQTDFIAVDDTFCNPVSLSAIDIDLFLGSRAGYYLADSDILYKLSGKNGYPVECAFLKGVPISESLPIDVPITGNVNTTFTSTVTGNMQVGLTIKCKPDKPETFLWQDEDTVFEDLNVTYKQHQDDCPFLLYGDHKSLYKQKDALEFDFEYPWEQCECKSVLYSPIGHTGATFDDYAQMADVIVLDTQDPNPFSLKDWRDLTGNDYKTSSDFAWYSINKTGISNEQGLDVDVGMGVGSWVTGSGEPFTLKKGRQYKYIRSGLNRPQSELNSNYIPPLVISYKYSHANKPSWTKGVLTTDGTWVETSQDSDMILNPSDYIMYDHFESNFYCLEYNGTYGDQQSTVHNTSALNPLNDIWVNYTYATTGVVINYQWPETAIIGIDDSIPQTTVLSNDLSSVSWAVEIDDGVNIKRYNSTLAPDLNFKVIGYTPQTINVVATGNVDGDSVPLPTGETVITLNPVTIVEPESTLTNLISGDKVKQTIYSDSINFMINVPLYGWDYSTNSFDGTSEGAKPFWGKAEDDDSFTTKFKGVREWGYGLRVADEYTFIHQPEVSYLTLNIDDALKYSKKSAAMIWVQPVEFKRENTIREWCDLTVDDAKTSPLSSYMGNQSKELVVYPTSARSTVSLQYGDFINYWGERAFTWTQNLTDSSAGVPPFGGTFVPFSSSVLIEADVPYANLTNRHFPTIAMHPDPNNFYTDKDSGSYFNHKGLGVLTFVNKDFVNIINPELSANQLTNEELIFRDPSIFDSSDYGLTGKSRKNPIVNVSNDSRWMKGNISEGYKAGHVVVEKDHKEFTPYQAKEETTKRTDIGIVDVNSELDPWHKPFDNEWREITNWPSNFRKQYPTNQWNLQSNHFIKNQYTQNYQKSISVSFPEICDDYESPCLKHVIAKDFQCMTCLGSETQEAITCFNAGGVMTASSYNITADGGVILNLNNDFRKLYYLPVYEYDEAEEVPSPDPFKVVYGEARDDVSVTPYGMISVCVNNVEFYTPVSRTQKTACETSNLSGVFDFDSDFYEFGYFPVYINEVDKRLIQLYTKGKIPTTSCGCDAYPDYSNCFDVTDAVPISAYYLDVLDESVIEGSDAEFCALTFNVPNGTILYWSVLFDGTDSGDFDSATQGTVTINNSIGCFDITTLEDGVVEGDESFRVELREDSHSGNILSTSNAVTILDLTYSITESTTLIGESEQITFTIDTTSVAENTILYWTLSGDGNVTANDFEEIASQGYVTVDGSGEATFSLTTVDEGVDSETNEQFIIELRTGNYAGTIKDTTNVITIAQALYEITAAPSSIAEGDTIGFTVSTANIDDGTQLFWTLSSDQTVDGDDFVGGVTTGDVTILSDTASFTLTSYYTDIGRPASAENFIIELRTESLEGLIRDTDPFVILEPQMYDITVAPISAYEGDNFVFAISTINVYDGTQLYWTLSSDGVVDGNDFDGGIVQGVETVSSNMASFILSSTDHLSYRSPDGEETFNLLLRSGGYTGTVEASDTFTVYDLDPTYDIQVNPISANEGDAVTFTVSTTNVADGTILYWSFHGAVSADDFTNTDIYNQPITINSNSNQFVRYVKQDSTEDEGIEVFYAGLSADMSVSPALTVSPNVAIDDTSFLNQYTDVYAVFDTTSLNSVDGDAAVTGLTSWHTTLSSIVDGYVGNMFIVPLAITNIEDIPNDVPGAYSERWLRTPTFIRDREVKMNTTGDWGSIGLEYRPDTGTRPGCANWSTESDPNTTNFVLLAFMDENQNEALSAQYHRGFNGTGAPYYTTDSDPLFDQPSEAYVIDFADYITTYNDIINSDGGVFKAVLYPVVKPDDYYGAVEQDYGVSKTFLHHAVACVYGTTFTSDELFGPNGSHKYPAPGGVYQVSASETWNSPTITNTSWVTLTSLTVENVYTNYTELTDIVTPLGAGLINHGWVIEPNKTVPASDVFSAETFGAELNDLLTS